MSNDIFKKACLVQLATSCWTGSKDIHQSQLINVGKNTEWLKGKKLLVNPEVLGPIKATVQMARKILARFALPFPISGLHLVPKDSIDEIDNRLEMFQADFNNKVSSFCDFYVEAREEAKTALGELFNDTDYPQDIRTKFRFTWRFLNLDVPTKATFITPETYLREKQKFIDLMDETRELAIAALRIEFSEVVTHLSDKVTGGDNKPKILRSNMTNRINEFLDGFSERNLFQDDKLTALVNEAKTLVKTINSNPYAVTYQDLLRQKVTTDFANLKTAIDAAIEEMPRRRIHLDSGANRGNLQEAA